MMITWIASAHFLACRDLTGAKKGLNKLPFSTNDHTTESFEPTSNRDFGCGVEPLRELAQLFRRDFSCLNTIQKVIEKCRWKISPADPRHRARRRKSRVRLSRARARLRRDPRH